MADDLVAVVADLPTFDEVLADLGDVSVHLLLGNGFSIQAWPSLEYARLFEVARDAGLSEQALRLFEESGSYSFEWVMRRLLNTKSVYAHYYPDAATVRLDEDLDRLKRFLIDAISGTHPASAADMNPFTIQSAVDFISRFQTVFTTSYDLILYYTYLNQEEDWEDAFWPHGTQKLAFEGRHWPDRKTVWYLHGAMHLYATDRGVYKRRRARGDGPLPQIISEAIDRGEPPLFVAEGSSEHKLRAIRSNPYLMAAYSAFSELSGALVVYGHSFSTDDRHLVDAVKKSAGISTVLLGVHDDNDLLSKLRTQRTLIGNGRVIRLFQSSSANVWRCDE